MLGPVVQWIERERPKFDVGGSIPSGAAVSIHPAIAKQFDLLGRVWVRPPTRLHHSGFKISPALSSIT